MSFKKIVNLILKAVGLAMGAAVVVLSILKSLDSGTAVLMLGIGLFAVSLAQFAGGRASGK